MAGDINGYTNFFYFFFNFFYSKKIEIKFNFDFVLIRNKVRFLSLIKFETKTIKFRLASLVSINYRLGEVQSTHF